jgi:Tfp pilus assembly protein FimT
MMRSRQTPAAPRRLGGHAGITSVELCVDITLVAILSLAAISLTNQYLEWGRIRSAAMQVAGAFQQARQYAIANAATYRVTLTGTTVAVGCTAGCPPGAPSEPATAITGDATTSVPGTPVTFDALGAATPGTVTISYPGGTQWQVKVSASGRVQTCSATCP